MLVVFLLVGMTFLMSRCGDIPVDTNITIRMGSQ